MRKIFRSSHNVVTYTVENDVSSRQIARHLNEDDTLLDEEYLRQLSTDTNDTEVIANSQSLLLRLVKTLNR